MWFDLIRGCSALVVCLGHLRNALLVDYSALVNPNILIKAFYFVTSLGHDAVMIFFVLSGYFVGGTILRSGDKFTWKSYLISRLTRLWVVLLPCLLITWCVGLVLEYYSPEVLSGANYYFWHSGPEPIEYSASFSTFLANFFFLQTIAFPVFGTNSPLWSLANEFWYYMLFPLLANAFGWVGLKQVSFRFLAFVIAMLIAWHLPLDVLRGFIVWDLGIVVYLLQSKIKAPSPMLVRIFLFMGVFLFALTLGLSKATNLIQNIPIDSDFLVGFSFAFLCLVLTYKTFPESRRPWLAKFSLHISEVSYSLYLSHFPIVILIASIIYQSHKFVPDAFMLIQYFGWGLLLLVLGSILWWFFESRTIFVRTRVSGFMNKMLVKT